MQLTVQQIIAKVASQNKSQTILQHQNLLLQQINTSTISNSQLTQINPKLPSQTTQNPHLLTKIPSKSKTKQSLINQPSLTTNQMLMQEKYMNLQATYKKLKRKEESQIHINQAYTEVQKKLQEIIKKNKKLQKELDSIRSKKSFFEQKSQQNNLKRKSIKQSELFTPHTLSLQKNIIPRSVQKEPKLNSRKQKHQLVKPNFQQTKNYESLIEESNFKVIKNEHKQIQQSNEISQTQKNRINYQFQTNTWCQREIQNYKEMIAEKKQSIIKLLMMTQRQDELIRNYEEISGTLIKQKNCKQDRIQQKTQKVCGKVSKIEGTIVKVKRLKQSEELKRNKQLTNRNTGFIKSRIMGQDRNELSGVMDEKTEIKIVQGRKQTKKQRDIESQRLELSYQRGRQDQNWIQSEAMNETSEFICEV